MRTKTGSGVVSWAGVEPALQQRFAKLFEVAGRKALFEWVINPDLEPELEFFDQNAPNRAATCSVFVGDRAASAAKNARFILSSEFTVGDLIDMLDRGALVLMEARSRASTRDNRARAELGNVEETGDGPPMTGRYKLTRWVNISSTFPGASYVRAVAVLSKASVSAQQLAKSAGLSEKDANRLLRHLDGKKLLVVQEGSVAARPVQPATPAALPPAGLVARLGSWLGGRRGSQPTGT